MLRRLDPELDPDRRKRKPPTDPEPDPAGMAPPPVQLRPGQRRSLEDVLNPARFAQADGVVNPTTTHTPVSLLILMLALVIVYAFLALPWVRADEAQVTGVSLLAALLDRDPTPVVRDGQLSLILLVPVLPLAVFLVFRAGLTVLYHENPVRGIWFWMLFAALVGLYPLAHTIFILDYLGAAFLETGGTEGLTATPGIGFWLALAADIAAAAFALAGWLFFSQREPR
jgi:hypothetical protein